MIGGEENPSSLDLALVVSEERNHGSQSELAMVVAGGGSELGEIVEKGKRGRKKRIVAAGEGGGQRPLQIVNRNGEVVDLEALASAEDPYGDELKSRTVGLDREEEILGVLRGLDGQWCSRRKKRKIVDASGFGESLPIGWKLLLGLKRREGRVSVYCRRYISPSGEQFVSCKEAAAYLQSYFGLADTNQPMGQRDDNIQQVNRISSESLAGSTHKDDDLGEDIIPISVLPSSSISYEYEKEVALLGIENLAEVEVRDLFECHKCNMTFDEKDTYLQHLLSSHQRTTRRYRLGTSVGDGVIVKDGKYECQFCHKIFQERRRYNGHVGIHVRNYVRNFEDMPGRPSVQKTVESPSRDELPSRTSKMDALIEIAQSSIFETSAAAPSDEPNGVCTFGNPDVISTPEVPTADSEHEQNLGFCLGEPEMEDSITNRTLDEELDQQEGDCVMADENTEKINGDSDAACIKMDCCLDTTTTLSTNDKNGCSSESFDGKYGVSFSNNEVEKSDFEQRSPETHLLTPSSNQTVFDVENNMNDISEQSKPGGVEEYENSGLTRGYGSSDIGRDNDVATMTMSQTPEDNVYQNRVSDSSMPLVHPLHSFPTYNAISDKGEDEFCCVDQKLQNTTGFDELKLDEIESLKFGFVTEQGPLSLPEVHMGLENGATMEDGFDSSIGFEPEEVMLSMTGRHQLTTACVWCRVEFSHEAVESEMQSDSVGFMCPTCKSKISGQLNVLDSGLSMNPHHL